MALTITIEGKGVIANADLLTNDTGGTGTGDWAELGGGSIAETGVSIQGGSAIAGAYSNKDGWQYFDLGVGNELDFTPTTGAEADQFIYAWVQMPALSQLDTLANEGLSLRIGSSTTDYANYTIAGNDDSNGWLGGWKCVVIDPQQTPTSVSGTINLASIQMIGFYINTASAGRGDNFFADLIAIGSGLRITGTSTVAWKDVVDYCTDPTRAWGMFEEREGVYYAKGMMTIGNTAQAAITTFADSNRIVKFETSEYYSGSAWVSGVPTTAFGIQLEDNATYKTDFTDGVIVGSANGRSGSTFIGSDNEAIIVDLHAGANSASATKLYGSKFQSISGAFNLGATTNHAMYSATIVGCNQFDPVGAPVIRNCIFAETTDVDAALLWNESIDISACSFLGNTLGAALEHPSAAGTPYSYSDLVFSGNTFDGLNSSGTDITVQKGGTSNPINDEGANTITYVSSVTIDIHVQDVDNVDIATAYVYINDDDAGTAEVNTTTDINGDVSTTYAGAVTSAALRIRKYGYKPFKDTVTLASDINRTITLIADPQQV